MAMSSTSSTKTPTANCRRDANCNCEICMESFNATKDLHSALTFPTTKTKRRILASSPPSTVSSISSLDGSQPSISTAKSRSKKKSKRRIRKDGFFTVRYLISLLFVVALLILASYLGGSELFEVRLKYETLETLFEEDGQDLGEGVGEEIRLKLGRLEKKLEGVVGVDGGVSKCSFLDSIWKLNQDEGSHLLYQWKCVIYKSVAEELSVWGSPLQTSGFIKAGFSSRFLTLLSGNITEVTNWSQGKLVPISRKSNVRSWRLSKFTSAAVQLENETWVLEYRRNALWDNTGLIQNVWMIFKGLGKQKRAMLLKLMHVFRSVFDGTYLKGGKQIVTPT